MLAYLGGALFLSDCCKGKREINSKKEEIELKKVLCALILVILLISGVYADEHGMLAMDEENVVRISGETGIKQQLRSARLIGINLSM